MSSASNYCSLSSYTLLNSAGLNVKLEAPGSLTEWSTSPFKALGKLWIGFVIMIQKLAVIISVVVVLVILAAISPLVSLITITDRQLTRLARWPSIAMRNRKVNSEWRRRRTEWGDVVEEVPDHEE